MRGQIVAEALRDLIRLALGTDPENSAGPVTEVTLVASASDPLDIRTAAGVKLQDGTVRRLLCDPRIFAAILNSLGVPLCRHHHRVTHRRGWSLHATDDSWFWWRTPTGRTFWSQRHGRPRTGPTPPDDPVTAGSCHHH